MKSEKSKKTAKDFYVDPNEMWDELDRFYKIYHESDNPTEEIMSSELGRMIDDIATKLGFMRRFINYSFKDEMIGDARVKMVKAVYDRNFTLHKTYYCTPVDVENGREYVIVFNENKHEWDDKRTYLKDWDVYKDIDTSAEVDSPDEDAEDGEKVVLETEDGNPVKNTITVRNNPFSYFTKIAFHAFVNRIKKEKKVGEILAAYQEKVYDEVYSSGNGWENVKRQRDEDEGEYYNEENEL